MTICKMAERHIGQIARIEKQCFSEPWSDGQLAEELCNPAAFFIVAERDGAVLGYIGAHIVCGQMYIANVAVERSCRRQGTALALMEYLVESARADRLEFITLEVRESNNAAKELYCKFGFELCGTRRRFYKDPDEDGQIFTLKLKERAEE